MKITPNRCVKEYDTVGYRTLVHTALFKCVFSRVYRANSESPGAGIRERKLLLKSLIYAVEIKKVKVCSSQSSVGMQYEYMGAILASDKMTNEASYSMYVPCML